MDENELCAKVSKIDPKIRFAGLINNKGRLVAGGMVGSVKSLGVKMRQEFDKDFGKVNFSLSYREKLIVMSFPFNRSVLFVSMDKRKEFDKIPFKILNLIDKLD